MLTKTTLFENKIQDITTSPTGQVQKSTNTIFNIAIGDNIFKYHPFFEGLEHFITTENQIYFTFPCVKFNSNEKEFYCDIIVKKESGYLVILFFNYSDMYQIIQEEESKKNKALLKSQSK